MSDAQDDGPRAADDDDATPPGVRIVAGSPTPEDIAAVTAVLRAAADAAAARGPVSASPNPRAGWDRAVRTPTSVPPGGSGDWVRSLR